MTPIQLNISPFPHFSRPVNRLAFLFLASILPICLLLLFLLPTSPASAQRPAEAESTNYSMAQALGFRRAGAAKAETYKLAQAQSSSTYNFLISSPDGKNIYSYAIPGDGTFGLPVLIYQETTAIVYQGFAIADYDMDGDLDFVSYDASGNLYLFEQISLGTFSRSTLLTGTNLLQGGFVAADFNNDGYFDIAGRTNTKQGRVFLNQHDGSFLGGNTFSYNNIAVVQSPAVPQYGAGDFNEDGKIDLAISSYACCATPIQAGEVFILLGDGQGNFGTPVQVATTPQEGQTTVVGDFNGDGRQDIISGQDDDGNEDNGGNDGDSGRAWIYFGHGDGTVNDSDEEAYDTYTGSGTNNRPGSGKAKPFTLDEDTYLDLIVVYCTAVSSGACTNFDLSYWRNQGDGFFVETLTLASGADPYLFSLPPSEGTYLPEFMVWNLKPDCPFCTAGQTEGDGGDPINTRNGNLSFDATDLSIPVLGGNLSFRRSYVSGGIDTYTQTLGYGWTHNFDIRLRLTNTHITGTVELQTPGCFCQSKSDPFGR